MLRAAWATPALSLFRAGGWRLRPCAHDAKTDDGTGRTCPHAEGGQRRGKPPIPEPTQKKRNRREAEAARSGSSEKRILPQKCEKKWDTAENEEESE